MRRYGDALSSAVQQSGNDRRYRNTCKTKRYKTQSRYEPGGRGFESCRARHNSRTWPLKTKPSLFLRDRCATLYPQGPASGIDDPQHRHGRNALRNAVGQGRQTTDVRTRIERRHRMACMPEQRRPIFVRHTDRAQPRLRGVSRSWTRTLDNPRARRAFCHDVLFIVCTGFPR